MAELIIVARAFEDGMEVRDGKWYIAPWRRTGEMMVVGRRHGHQTQRGSAPGPTFRFATTSLLGT
jgi:hypothetical protein